MQVQVCKANVSSFDISKAITFSRIFSKVDLTASARQVLRCLADFYNPKKGLVYPGQNTIADCTGVSQRSVITGIKELRTKGLILTTGNAGERLNYYFTTKFFELIQIALPSEKSSHDTPEISSQHEQHESKQINNIKSFKKNNLKNYPKPLEGIKYKSASETVRKIEKDKETSCTPLDFDKTKAIEYYNKLPEFAKNGFYARELKKKWDF